MTDTAQQAIRAFLEQTRDDQVRFLAELVKANKLEATPEQVKAQVEEFAQSYEDPQQVMKYYFSDRRRLSEVEALVLEDNVVNHVLGQAKVTEKPVAFDELMGNNA